MPESLCSPATHVRGQHCTRSDCMLIFLWAPWLFQSRAWPLLRAGKLVCGWGIVKDCFTQTWERCPCHTRHYRTVSVYGSHFVVMNHRCFPLQIKSQRAVFVFFLLQSYWSYQTIPKFLGERWCFHEIKEEKRQKTPKFSGMQITWDDSQGTWNSSSKYRSRSYGEHRIYSKHKHHTVVRNIFKESRLKSNQASSGIVL